jgi:hypothetical protein
MEERSRGPIWSTLRVLADRTEETTKNVFEYRYPVCGEMRVWDLPNTKPPCYSLDSDIRFTFFVASRVTIQMYRGETGDAKI